MYQRKILFLVLSAFSSTGGIEKFNRAFLKGLQNLRTDLSLSIRAAGMYDHTIEKKYTGDIPFKPFNGNRFLFVLRNIFQLFFTDELILGHINLALLGVIFKRIKPSGKLILICHGIEVFEYTRGLKKKVLQKADVILAVSTFTKEKIISKQNISADKIIVFPNTIDPYFNIPRNFQKPGYLQQRYKIQKGEKVIFTLTRLRSNEGYKGYSKVINILPQLLANGMKVKYILAGGADEKEKIHIQKLISDLKLEQHVLLTDFIREEEIQDHYLLADVFVMPSKGEGFGIVYIEAMACGLPVIAGNKDGSTEALRFGELGVLIDPDSEEELMTAIKSIMDKKVNPKQIQENMLHYFSFQSFTAKLNSVFEQS